MTIEHLPQFPAWPGSLPTPRFGWGYDDHGRVFASLQVGDDLVHTFEGFDGDLCTSLDDGDDGNPDWNDDEREAVDASLRVAHERAHSVVGQIEYQAAREFNAYRGLHGLVSRPRDSATDT